MRLQCRCCSCGWVAVVAVADTLQTVHPGREWVRCQFHCCLLLPATRPGRKWAGSKLRVLLLLAATRPGRKWAGGSRLRWLFCGGDARAPVYSEEQSRDTCEDPQMCSGDSQQTEGGNKTGAFRGLLRAIPSRPTHGTISSTSLPQQDLSQRQAAQRSKQKLNRICHGTIHIELRWRGRMHGHGHVFDVCIARHLDLKSQ